jgi:hypothetical protein
VRRMHTDEPNYYDTLQISPDANQGAVAAAYRRLARKYHPDLNRDPSGAVRMKELNAAFEVLGDPGKRAAYDARRLGSTREFEITRPNQGGPPFAQSPRQPRPPRGSSGSRSVGLILCLIVSLAVGIPTAMVVIRGAVGGEAGALVAATSSQPIFDPATSGCVNQPPVTLDRAWQTSAPNAQSYPIRPLETVQIGLRDQNGSPMETLLTSAGVVGPDGSTFTAAAKVLSGQTWTYALYPADFAGAPPLQAGTYTVIWQIAGGFVACDGFVVQVN